ncbi:MAG: universal stress protein [Rhodovarius sp.]|nr:universal stress protein [Rhodovarius sp.]
MSAPPTAADRPILAATDLSSRSDRALARAALLAAELGAPLVLLHALDDDQPPGLLEAARREARLALQRLAAALPGGMGRGAELLLAQGDPYRVIQQVAAERGARLLVLGEHRRRPLADMFLGTTAERVLRSAPCPVLMVHRPAAGPYAQVLVATDLSDRALAAWQAAALLGLLQRAQVSLLHVRESPPLAGIALGAQPPAAAAAAAEERQAQSGAALADWAARGPALPAPRLLLQEGPPAMVIVEQAAALQADLVVLGTAGRAGLARAILGSVAAQVLGEIGCDALALPPQA